MLKEVKKLKNSCSPIHSNSKSAASVIDLSDSSSDNLLIGYSKANRICQFKSNDLHHNPLLSPAPVEEWNEDSPGGSTSARRKEFHSYLEVSLDVKSYQMRPVKIPFIDGRGNRREYQPLLLIHHWNYRSQLADVWNDKDIRADADWFVPAWRAAHRFARQHRLNFRLYRNSFFSSDYFHNIKFMNNYRWLEPDEKNWNMIKEILEELGVITFSTLYKIGKENKKQDGKLIRTIWTLVAMGCIQAYWDKRFNQDSELWVIA